jgi:glucose/mannose-6-phosphate isomerase
MAWKEKLRWVVQQVTGDEKENNPGNAARSESTRGVLLDAHKHFKQGIKIGSKIALEDIEQIEHLTGVGMGGSMHPFFILQSYLNTQNCKKPINVIRDYTIPTWVSKKGFLFIISYSGNTEEPIGAYRQAYRQGYRMLVMAAGGKLKEIAQQHGTTFVELPAGYQPRHSFYIMLGVVLQILANSGIIVDLDKEVAHIDTILRKSMFDTMGKQLAEKLQGKIPIIYTTTKLGRVAERWKICLNENAKMHAFANIIPELNHNEINAYVTKNGPFHTLFLADEQEKREHQKRISVTKQVIQEHGYEATEIVIKGPTPLSRMISAIYMGDWTSYHSALLAGVDPEEVAVIERFKKLLKE